MIRKIVSLAALCSMFSACENPKRNPPAKDTVAKDTAPAAPAVVSAVMEIRPVIDYTPWEGDLQGAISWKDAKGENVLVLSIVPQYFWEEQKPEKAVLLRKEQDRETDTELTEFFAQHYVLAPGESKWKEFTRYHDYLFGCCDVWMEFQPGSLSVSDYDKNGTGEVTFMYHVTEADGVIGNTWTGKMVTMTDTVKYVSMGPTGAGNFKGKSEDLAAAVKWDKRLYNEIRVPSAEFWRKFSEDKINRDKQPKEAEEGHEGHNH